MTKSVKETSGDRKPLVARLASKVSASQTVAKPVAQPTLLAREPTASAIVAEPADDKDFMLGVEIPKPPLDVLTPAVAAQPGLEPPAVPVEMESALLIRSARQRGYWAIGRQFTLQPVVVRMAEIDEAGKRELSTMSGIHLVIEHVAIPVKKV